MQQWPRPPTVHKWDTQVASNYVENNELLWSDKQWGMHSALW